VAPGCLATVDDGGKPVDEHTGALELIPGSWESPLPHVMTDTGHFQLESEHLPSTPRETVPLQAGDVLVLDRFIPHRSLPVRAGCVRWAIVMWVKAISPDQNV
jgi:ectoine hydroxylase-related dioxygenase (phytanoyl-CoA dioxygenase family)